MDRTTVILLAVASMLAHAGLILVAVYFAAQADAADHRLDALEHVVFGTEPIGPG